MGNSFLYWRRILLICLAVLFLAPQSGQAQAALTITPTFLPSATIGVPYSATLTVSGGVTPYTWSLNSPLPPGISFSFFNTTATISGTPTTTGSANFSVTVSEIVLTRAPLTLTQTIFFFIDSNPVITTPSLPPGEINVPYSATVIVVDADLPLNFRRIGSGSLPPGLTLSSTLSSATAMISGTPTAGGVFTFSVEISDGFEKFVSKTLTIAITTSPLSILTNSLAFPVVGAQYLLTLQVSGGVAPFTWRIAEGSLPTGLSLSSAGSLSGTPTNAGTFSFTFQVTDGTGQVATRSFTLSVCVASIAPTSRLFSSAGGSGTASVITEPGCHWSVSRSGSFINITSGTTGTGSGTVTYTVAANTAPAGRTGTLIIAGQTLTINQIGIAPLFLLRPDQLSISFVQGGPFPEERIISLFSSNAGLAFTAKATTASGGDWLSVNPATGTAPSSIIVSVNPTNLPPGVYEGQIAVTSPNASPSLQTVSVSLTVEASGETSMAVVPNVLLFPFVLGPKAGQKQLTVSNEGAGSLNFQITFATFSGGSWLTVAPASGTATLAAPSSVVVTADPAGLAAGTYLGQITITPSPAAESINVPVTMTVSTIRQVMRLSQRGLTFTGIAGVGAVPPQTIGVVNIGQDTMDWSVSTLMLSGIDWLTVSPPNGSTAAASGNVPQVTVSVNPAELAAGVYYGQVSVTSPTAVNSPQIASIVLNVLQVGSDPGQLVQPTGLIFTGVVGGDPPDTQTITLSNLTDTPKTFTLGQFIPDGSNWFTAVPATGTVGASPPNTIFIQPRIAGLSAGIRPGLLTIAFGDGTVQTVEMVQVLADTGGTTQRVPPIARLAGCNPATLHPVFTLLGNQFNVSAAWPVPIEVNVADDCGDPLTTGSVLLTFSNGDPPLPLGSLEDGRWSGTWQARNAGVAEVTITATAAVPGTPIRGTAQLVGGLQANPAVPQVGEGAVVSAASFAQRVPASPGSLISIFGVEMADATGSANALPLATQLAGTTVLLGGQTLPLLFSSAGQINAQFPYGIATDTQHQLVVQRGTSFTVPEQVTVAAAQPAIFTLNQSGQGQGLVFVATATTLVLADASNPARANDVVVIWCAGLGAVDQPVAAGEAAPASPPARTVNPVTLTIGGVNATVQFAGLAPFFTGLYQVNAVVPNGVQPGNAVPVVLNVAGQSSPPVTMAVQ